jgi:hypothetical protein
MYYLPSYSKEYLYFRIDIDFVRVCSEASRDVHRHTYVYQEVDGS